MAVRDVLGNGALEQPRVLQHHAKLAAQVRAGKAPCVRAVQRNAASVHLVEAHEQVDEGRLAGAGLAHDGHLLAGSRHEAHVAHERLVRRVAKAHVLERHASAYGLRKGRRRLGIRHDLLLVQQDEHALRRRESTLQHVQGERQLRQRLGRLEDVLEERLERADGEPACHEHAAREHAADDLRQPHEEADGRRDGIREEVCVGAHLRKLLRVLAHSRERLLLATERLDDGAAAVRLLHPAREAAEHVLTPCRHGERPRGHDLREDGRQCREHQEHAGEKEAHARHEDEGAHEGDCGNDDLQQAALQDLGHLVQVVRGAADGVARLVRVEVAKRQALDLARYLLAQLQVQPLREARHDQGLHAVERPRKHPDAQVDQNVHAAVLHGDAKRLPVCERLLDARPQVVDKACCVHGRHEVGRDVQHRRDGCDHKAPANAGR